MADGQLMPRGFRVLRATALAALLAGGVASRLPAQDDTSFDLASIPADFLDLSNVLMASNPDGGITAMATATLGGTRTFVLYTSLPRLDGSRGRIMALRPDRWSLTEAIPGLANPALDGLTLSNVTLVLSEVDTRLSAEYLTDEQRTFFAAVFGDSSFSLVLKPGINLIAAIPAENLPADSPLLPVMDALGIERGNIILQGTLGRSLALLRGGVSSAALRDVMLRAELPQMRPPGSPTWFRSGQLALEITGAPSVRLVGEMNVLIDQAELEFFLSAMLARTGVSLAGGMRAAQPWVAPFGVSWLTMKSVVLSLGFSPLGVSLGFGGAAVIGTKDIDVAVGVTLSPAGVPSSFLLRGASDSGVALTDLAAVQQGMARAAEAAAGETSLGSGAPLIPLEALPDIAIRSLELQFAPQANLELGIERGFKVRGRLWLPTGSGGELRDFAGIDAGVTDEGLWVRGDLGAFRLGPLAFDDAKLDLTATRTEQHLIVRGQVQLGPSRQLIDLNINRQSMSFRSETVLFGLFSATLNCAASFQLTNPSFMVEAVFKNDFGEYLQPLLRQGILNFANAGRVLIGGAQVAADAAGRVLAVQEATVAQLRAAHEAIRDNAEAAWRTAQSNATAAYNSAESARRSRDAAWRLYDGTPGYQVALKAGRYADYVRLAAVYGTRLAAYAAARTIADGRQAIFNAIPPVDRAILVMAAEAATAELRRVLTVAQGNLQALATKYDAIIDAIEAGADPFSVQYAAFRANMSALNGGAAAFTIRGVFVGRPFELRRELDFGSPVQAVAGILSGLVGS